MNIDQLDEAFTGQPVMAADVVAAIVVLIVSLGCAWLVGRLLRRYFGRPGNESDQMAKLLGRVGQWSIGALGLAWALNIVGLERSDRVDRTGEDHVFLEVDDAVAPDLSP